MLPKFSKFLIPTNHLPPVPRLKWWIRSRPWSSASSWARPSRGWSTTPPQQRRWTRPMHWLGRGALLRSQVPGRGTGGTESKHHGSLSQKDLNPGCFFMFLQNVKRGIGPDRPAIIQRSVWNWRMMWETWVDCGLYKGNFGLRFCWCGRPGQKSRTWTVDSDNGPLIFVKHLTTYHINNRICIWHCKGYEWMMGTKTWESCST